MSANPYADPSFAAIVTDFPANSPTNPGIDQPPWPSPPVIEDSGAGPPPGPDYGPYSTPEYIAAVLGGGYPGATVQAPVTVPGISPGTPDLYTPTPGPVSTAVGAKLGESAPGGVFSWFFGAMAGVNDELARMLGKVPARSLASRFVSAGKGAFHMYGRRLSRLGVIERRIEHTVLRYGTRIVLRYPYLTGAALMLYPIATAANDTLSALSPGELERLGVGLAPMVQPARYLGVLPGDLLQPPGQVPVKQAMMPFNLKELLIPKPMTIGEQIIRGIIAGHLPNGVQPRLTWPQDITAGPPPPVKPYDSGIKPYVPPTPTVNIPGPQPGKKSGIGRQVMIGAGTILGGGLLQQAIFGGSRAPAPTAALLPTPASIVAPVAIGALTAGGIAAGLFYGGTSSSPTSVGGCACRKPRGKAKKCLERAGVKWSGGRYKGKAAGNKCIRFAA